MQVLEKETLFFRFEVLKWIRMYLWDQGFWEVDTPCLKPVVGMEPHLDPFLVQSPSGKERGYLITSPEYSLKQIMAKGVSRVFELAHTFRSGEVGSPFHTKEFLMLELYIQNLDDQGLMDWLEVFFQKLFLRFFVSNTQEKAKDQILVRRATVLEEFQKNTNRSYSAKDLIETILEHKLSQSPKEELSTWLYEDLFFLVFLNCVEPNLGSGILFLYEYPEECAALARVENGVAKRFEVYWDGLELANAFYELRDESLQRTRFLEEQNLRMKLGKECFPLDEDFLSALSEGFPDCSGISIGVDRLLLRLRGGRHLKEISPYASFNADHSAS